MSDNEPSFLLGNNTNPTPVPFTDSKVEREKGEPTEANPVSVAHSIGCALSHGCMPNYDQRGQFTNIKDLHLAMEKECDEYNSTLTENTRWMAIGPWHYNEENETLSHTTGSGRMSIIVGNDSFKASLFSPSYKDAQDPYYELSIIDGELRSTLKDPSILEGGARLDRLNSVSEFIADAIPIEKIFDASDGETLDALIKSHRYYLDKEIKYRETELESYKRNGIDTTGSSEQIGYLKRKRAEVDEYIAKKVQGSI